MKKCAPYILILIIVLVGLFSPVGKAEAVDPVEGGECTDEGSLQKGTWYKNPDSQTWECQITPITPAPTTPAPTTPAEKSEFAKWATDESCGIIGSSSVAGCIKAIFYYVVYTPSAVLLSIAAKFFNALIAISLSSTLFSNSSFIPPAWAVVRDLSNIFFILILLYIAVKVILGIGGSDVKKMIAKVVIIALLINFSMFFTQVIIDSSNILALIFYNKLDVTYKDPKTGEVNARPYDGATGTGEKDISGSMYSGFDITSKLNSTFWEQTKAMSPDSNGQPVKQVPVGTMVGIIVVAAAIMLFAAYAFFISGIFFVARMIELFVLIIFSPFAFISYTIPGLAKYEYIGWDAWSKRLIEVAFMAPIFMFFMYLIFSLLNAKLFGSLITVQKDWIQTILGVVVPGMMILILLLQAVKFAKKGAGAIGEMVMKGAKMAGGLALGAAGGAGLALSGGIGSLASRAASSKGLNEKAKDKGFGGMAARMALGTAKYGSRASFDVRAVPGVGSLAKMGGLDIGKAKEGGYAKRRADNVKKRLDRAKDLEVGEDEYLKQELNKTEMNLQVLLRKNAQEIKTVDLLIDKKRDEARDAERNLNAVKGTGTTSKKGVYTPSAAEITAQGALKEATDQVTDAKNRKTALREGKDYTEIAGKKETHDYAKGGTKSTVADSGDTIDDLEKQQKTDAQAIVSENVDRRQKYAERKVRYGGNGIRTDREAAHKIITEVKLDSGTKT